MTAQGTLMALADSTAAHRGGETDVLARLLACTHTPVMGILNVTPDSFSDGGRFLDPESAVAQAQRLVAEGADVIDIGAESSRPYVGAVAVPDEEEIARLAPVLARITSLGVPVSIDSMKAPVVEWALRHGATIVNDVWGLQRDPDIARVVAEHGAPVVIMHNRAKADPTIDIMGDIQAFLNRSLDAAARAGIPDEHIVLDPGIGFGKTPQQSIETLANFERLTVFGLPLLIGASRKRFIDSVSPAPPDQRLGGSIAAHLVAVMKGAAIVRAHDVAETVQALRVAAAIRNANV
jgi:dihydropteroate synthase